MRQKNDVNELIVRVSDNPRTLYGKFQRTYHMYYGKYPEFTKSYQQLRNAIKRGDSIASIVIPLKYALKGYGKTVSGDYHLRVIEFQGKKYVCRAMLADVPIRGSDNILGWDIFAQVNGDKWSKWLEDNQQIYQRATRPYKEV